MTLTHREIERIKRTYRDPRPFERLKAHYDLERRLADRLRQASPSERARMYPLLYEELFTSLPDHPQAFRMTDVGLSNVDRQAKLLRPLLSKSDLFLELGAGDCRLSFAISSRVAHVLALDITDVMYDRNKAPRNFTFVRSSGVELPLKEDMVDFAYSNQLMEHLHVDDALRQLRSILRVLKQGGRYLCITPNAIAGPHDISRYFDDVAKGLHMKEYRYRELVDLFHSVGFRDCKLIVAGAGCQIATFPPWAACTIESGVIFLPRRIRQRFARFKPVRIFLGIRLLARK